RRHLPPAVLSMGQRKRLELARVFLADERSIWLLDEPTVALDAASVAAVEAAIAGQRAAGGMVVVSTNAPVALPDAAHLAVDAAAPDEGDAQADDPFATAW
ncbi:MAG: ATP-binding cassette domain-containing protein, partial [Alphaproteobacteria bacterium]